MSAQTESTNQIAPKTGRNQLVIIALLIVIIYAAASVVLGFSNHVDPAQKSPLIWFMVVFPLLVLGVFGWLVSRHHGKLYAAAETVDGDMFLMTLTPDQQRRKLNSEVAAILQETLRQATPSSSSAQPAKVVDQSGRQEARSTYIVAEDLVLRRLEIERGPSFMRHVTLEGVPFDGVVIRSDKIIGIEVKFLISPVVSQGTIDTLMDKAEYAATRLKRTRPGSSFTFLLAVVTQMTDEDEVKLKTALVNKFATTSVDIDVEFFDFGDLQNEFAADNSAE